MTEVNKEAIGFTLVALKEIEQIEKRANNVGIILEVHDNLHSFLIKALNSLLPNLGGNFEEFGSFTIDQILQLSEEADKVKSIGFSFNKIFIKYIDGKEWIIDNGRRSE